MFPIYRAENVSMFASVNKDADLKKICEPAPTDFKPDDRKLACDTYKMMYEYEGQSVKSEEMFG